MSDYQGHCTAIVGTNGTGKTTISLKAIEKEKRSVLIVMDDDSEIAYRDFPEVPEETFIFKGKGVSYSPFEKKEKEIYFKKLYDEFGKLPIGGDEFQQVGGLLVFNDAMNVLDERNKGAMMLLQKRRQRCLDIIMDLHGFSQFPRSLVKNLTHIIVGTTLDSTKEFSSRMNSVTAERFTEIVNYVNKRTEKEPFFKILFDIKKPENSCEFKL